MIRCVQGQRRQGHHGDTCFCGLLDDGGASRVFDVGKATRAILVGAGQQNRQQAVAVGVGSRGEQVIDGRPN